MSPIFFSTFFHFLPPKGLLIPKSFVFLQRPYPRPRANGWGQRHIEKRHWCFVFDRLNYHNQIPIKDKCRDECYGCSIYSRSVQRANHVLTHTFGLLYIYQRGYSDSVRSIGKAVVGRWTHRHPIRSASPLDGGRHSDGDSGKRHGVAGLLRDVAGVVARQSVDDRWK